MLSLCLTSYSLGKDLPETNGGSFLLSIILALKKIEENPEKLSQDFTVLFFEEKKREKKKNQHKLLYLIAE